MTVDPDERLLAPASESRGIPRWIGPFFFGACVALSLSGIVLLAFHKPLIALGTRALVIKTLEPVASEQQLSTIRDELKRVGEWYTSGEIGTDNLFTAVEVCRRSPIIAFRASDALRRAMERWPGVDPSQANQIRDRFAAAVHAGFMTHGSLRETLGDNHQQGEAMFFYGETTLAPIDLTEERAAEVIAAIEALLDERAARATPLGPDLSSWLRAAIDAEVGWAVSGP
ncbi:MAG: hypothetical protein AAGB51_07400 [Planctomycetota bacterium]